MNISPEGATAMSVLFLRAPAAPPVRAGEPEALEGAELVPAE